MAAGADARLGEVFVQAGTPQELQTFVVTALSLTTVPDLLGYVIRAQYEQEWRDIVAGAFPDARGGGSPGSNGRGGSSCSSTCLHGG